MDYAKLRRSLLCAAALSLTTLLGMTTAYADDQPPGTYPIAELTTVTPIKSCSDLATTDLTDIGGAGSVITSAAETTTNGIQYCTVNGTLAPSIGFTVTLPVSTWTQRYLQLGCGGLCGKINLTSGASDGCAPLTRGEFVQASTDMGHQGSSGDFGNDPQKRRDFAYRGVHLTSVVAKKLIASYYGQAQKYAYFNGCSDGGREAVMEAQRFPDDFDGVIAGAPAMNFQAQNAVFHAWMAHVNTGADGKAILTAARLPLLHSAVLAQCDTLDGLKDGLISNPLACHFDPATLRCPSGNANSSHCLTDTEVDVVQKFYQGPVDKATGTKLIVGGPQFGSELAWAGVYVPYSADQPIFSTMIAQGAIQYLSFEHNPATFDLAHYAFDMSTFDQLRALHPLYDATNPDLSGFHAHGGKLILWHGWADPHISPLNTIAYHEAVQKVMGKEVAASFERLYLFPGMYHCQGGEGPNKVDLLTPMMSWVEQGNAPDVILSQQNNADSHSDKGFGDPNGGNKPKSEQAGAGSKGDKPHGMPMPPISKELMAQLNPPQPERTRPVYPFPAIARYSGKGNPNLASKYVRGEPAQPFSEIDWAGKAFFTPYQFKD
ncbi:tannase/feruloyl esterase family alpha/beta hydrolase [Pokkaliibacter plantistimulans]|nr:tannase/feruloyl esterase family alpha/beta hydrolase [Pokkaliibacter plantistimulans]